MNILWLVNLPLPDVRKHFNLSTADTGGWINGQLEQIKQMPHIILNIMCPSTEISKVEKLTVGNINYIVFPPQKNNQQLFKSIYDSLSPDLVQIFGTEFTHSYDMMKISNPDKTVVSIQGLLYLYENKYLIGLPRRYEFANPIKVLMKKIYCADVIKYEKDNFAKRAKYEIETLKMAKYVIGRTDWDKNGVLTINPNIKYFKCNEILRESFYTDNWDLNNCEKHTIFISQAKYPIKGLHIFLKQFAEVLKIYPDAKLIISGDKPLEHKNKIIKLGVNYFFEYQTYCQKIIKENNLQNNVIYIGTLNEQQMKEQYLKSHVFLSTSLIENESNSISEARILGVPVVSSYVGGVIDRIKHNEDGYLYPLNEPELASYYINKIFNDDKLALEFSRKGKETQEITNNKNNNINTLLKIYKQIIN